MKFLKRRKSFHRQPRPLKQSGKNRIRLEQLEPRVLLNATSAQEQLFVYLLNKARSDPQAYEAEANLSVSLDGISARQPLAVNEFLHNSSQFHAQEMADNNYFGHQSALTGDWPNKMAHDAGYNHPWIDASNQIESIAAGYGQDSPDNAADTLKLLIEDEGVNPPLHRYHLMGASGWATHTEIGAGYDYNASSDLKNYWAIHTAYEQTSDLFLTGVVYQDQNGNQQYDLNEGLANVTVTTDQQDSTVTNSAGGWSIPITAGTYIVSASNGSFDGTGSAVAIVSDSNVEVDFISGNAAGTVDFGLDTGSGLPKVSIAASDSQAAESNLDPAAFLFTRTGSTDEPMTVNYTISGTAQNTTDYNTLTGSVVIPMGQSSASITITPVNDEDIEGQETIVLSLLASLDYQFGTSTTDTATIVDDDGALVSFGDGIAKSIIFTDTDGTTGTISLKSATGTIIFTGEGITTEQGKSSVTVSGSAEMTDIDITSSGPSASLSFNAKGGDGLISVENITINGSAKDIKGKQVDLLGDITVTGGLTKLELNNVADQHLINIGPPDTEKSALTIKMNQVTDLGISSESPIKSLTAVNWQDGGFPDQISAPRLDKLSVKENFPAFLFLQDSSVPFTLGTVQVGDITGGIWSVAGNAKKITANSIDNLLADFEGDLGGISIKQDLSAVLVARSIKSVSVKGDFTDSELILSQLPVDAKTLAMGKITVNGTMDHVDIRSQGNIGNVTTGILLDSNIFAGVNNSVTGLPTSDSNLDTLASIANVKIKGSKTEPIWMQNSNIAADSLGSMSLGFAQTDNGGVEFGLAGNTFKSIAYKDDSVSVKTKTPEDILAFQFDDLIARLL